MNMDNRNRDKDARRTDDKNRQYADSESRLQFLDEVSDYKVASDDPDVRGWSVVDEQDHKIGKVDNLLVDVGRKKVRYLDVDLDREWVGEDHEPFSSSDVSGVHEYQKEGEVHMIVPIGLARLDRDNKRVISDHISQDFVRQGHVHRKGEHITPDHEQRVLTSFRSERRPEPGTERPSSGTPNASPVTGAQNQQEPLEGDRKPGSKGDYQHENPNSGESRPSDQRPTNDENRTTSEHREMRRPDSPKDTRLSEERYDRSASDTPGSGRASEEQRHEDEDDFYDNDYFDERRFYGRR